MGKAHLAALALALLVLRWLITAHVTVMVAGFPVVVPVLAVAASALAAVAAAVVALVVYRGRAERAGFAAWQARQVRPAGSVK
jgi:hypothetical protein